MLAPAVRLARKFGVSLAEIGRWVELAYFHELRRDGLTLSDAGDCLAVSRRKAADLSRMLKENFFAPEREYEVARRIEFMVWAEPMSRARIVQTLGDTDEDQVDEAIAQLLDEGRIVEVAGRTPTYEIARGESRLVRNTWLAKIDALNNLLSTITDAVYARFFERDDKALARNLELRVRAEDLQRLRKLYEQHIWPELNELDERARSDPSALPMNFSVCWAPRDFLADRMDDESTE